VPHDTAPPAPTPEPPLTLRQKRRRELVSHVRDVAMREFAEHGFASVSVQRLCELAGISESTFFRHFGTKEEVVADAFRQSTEEVALLMRQEGGSELVEPYLRALREAFRSLGLEEADLMYRVFQLVITPRVRAVFIEDVARPHPAMDAEIARRLGVTDDDARVRAVRAVQWIATDQAMAMTAPGDTLDDLVERLRENLVLLAEIEHGRAVRGASRT